MEKGLRDIGGGMRFVGWEMGGRVWGEREKFRNFLDLCFEKLCR